VRGGNYSAADLAIRGARALDPWPPRGGWNGARRSMDFAGLRKDQATGRVFTGDLPGGQADQGLGAEKRRVREWKGALPGADPGEYSELGPGPLPAASGSTRCGALAGKRKKQMRDARLITAAEIRGHQGEDCLFRKLARPLALSAPGPAGACRLPSSGTRDRPECIIRLAPRLSVRKDFSSGGGAQTKTAGSGQFRLRFPYIPRGDI